jgi:2',3'-cyclic-nucleotide 2'-phosphodiesterase/3'-nucleotidase/5'-nucleotidase
MRRAAALGSLAVLAVAGSTAPADARRGESLPDGVVGAYATGLGEASAEIVAFDDDRAYVINTATTVVDILDVHADGSLALRRRVDLAPFGAGGNSVAVHDGVVAVALDAAVRTDPGVVVFLDADGEPLGEVTVGAVPDMVTFTPDGRRLLVANEGEPSGYGPGHVDPEGSVSIVDVRQIIRPVPGNALGLGPVVATADFTEVPIPAGVRTFGPGATPAQDLEPEYIAVDDRGRTAYVTLQEANAVAVVDIAGATVTRILPLGLKDHRDPANALDANDQDGIAIAPAGRPVFGMYQPDAIDTFEHQGRTYLVTANEGDVREWPGYAEGARAGSANVLSRLDPVAFPLADPQVPASRLPAALRRLTVSTATGDTDGDGDLDQLHAFGARSFSIWTEDGELVFDSGDDIEQLVRTSMPSAFNVSNSNNTVDNRSDDKGPEPEGLTIGEVAGRRYAFITLERVGGVLVYDLTDPAAPTFVTWLNNRTYGGVVVGPDAGPEGVAFVDRRSSPTDQPLLLVGNEVTGTVTAYG